MAEEKNNCGDNGQKTTSNWLELLAMWFSIILILAAAGFLVYEGVRPSSPASFRITTEPVRDAEGVHYVPLVVSNTGGQSAHSLRLEVRLDEKAGGKPVEKSQLNVQWVPAGSERRATAAFEHDPAKYDLRVRVQGYEQP